MLAVEVFLIDASQIQVVTGALNELVQVALVFICFLFGAAALGWMLTRLFALPPSSGRALTFSLGTRNSFMVLSFALALLPTWEVAAVVIVLQSLVELFGILAFFSWVPGRLIPDPGS